VPGGLLFVLVVLAVVSASASLPLRLALPHTVAAVAGTGLVELLLRRAAPTADDPRTAGARLVILALVGALVAILTRRLALEETIARVARNAVARRAALDRALLANGRRNAARLGRLIDDLLTLNQLDVGALRLESAPLDLRVVADAAVAAVAPLLREKGQALAVALPRPLPTRGRASRRGCAATPRPRPAPARPGAWNTSADAAGRWRTRPPGTCGAAAGTLPPHPARFPGRGQRQRPPGRRGLSAVADAVSGPDPGPPARPRLRAQPGRALLRDRPAQGPHARRLRRPRRCRAAPPGLRDAPRRYRRAMPPASRPRRARGPPRRAAGPPTAPRHRTAAPAGHRPRHVVRGLPPHAIAKRSTLHHENSKGKALKPSPCLIIVPTAGFEPATKGL